MAKTTLRPKGLNGETGLLAAVIDQALNDAYSDNWQHAISGLAYFKGPDYRHHVTLLGLPPDIKPELIEMMTDDQFINLIGKVKNDNQTR